MARSASLESVISTKAKPRERPVSLSVISLTLSTVPYGWKRERIDSSVAPKSKLPTNMFFKLISLPFESVLNEAELNLDQVVRDNQTHLNYSS
jgi:hypothetical protein